MLTSWKKLLLSLVLIFGFTSGVYAVGTPVTSNPYIPHVFLAGYAGSGVVGTGDVLAPIWLKNDRNFFFYGQGNYGYADEDWSDNPWTGSAGFGYRQIGNHAVYGLFVLSDYNHTLTNHNVWQVSPGLEILGRAWEFRANGYIPIGDKNWNTQGWADEFGNYDYVTFNGHNQYDAWFIYHEEIGGGADAEIGRTLFKVKHVLVRGLVNGYYFHMTHNNNLRGGGASIEVEPNTYLKFTAKGSYDNYAHTQVAVGVQVSLYDLFSSDSKVLNDQDLQRRLFEPVQRNFANIASGNDVSTAGAPDNGGVPQVVQFMGHNAPERTNVWFFSPTATGGDGTFENPYGGSLTQGDVNGIANYTTSNGYATAYMYFTSGLYSAYASLPTPGLVGTVFGPIIFDGNFDWNIEGRAGADNGYQELATGEARSTLEGSLSFNGNFEVAGLILRNTEMPELPNGFAEGISGRNAAEVNLDDVDIDGFPTGIDLDNVDRIDIIDTVIKAMNNQPTPTAGVAAGAADAVGIKLENSNNTELNIENSTVDAESTNGDGIGIDLIGSELEPGLSVAAVKSIQGINSIIRGMSETANGYGLYADFAAVPVADSEQTTIGSIAGVAFEGVGATMGAGLYVNTMGTFGKINIGAIKDANFKGTADVAAGTAYGLFVDSRSSSTTNAIDVGDISDSKFQATGLNATGFHANTTSTGQISIGNITNSEFLASPAAVSAGVGSGIGYGFYALTDSKITIGSLIGNVFNGGNVGPSTGFYAYSDAVAGGVLSIANTVDGQITGNTFAGVASAMDLYGAQVNVLGTNYAMGTPTDGDMLKSALNTAPNNNTFPAGQGKVCVNGNCSTP